MPGPRPLDAAWRLAFRLGFPVAREERTSDNREILGARLASPEVLRGIALTDPVAA